MPPVESLKPLVSFVMTEQTDKYKQPLVLAVTVMQCTTSPEHTSTAYVCETCTSKRQKNFIEMGSWRNSTRRSTARRMLPTRGKRRGGTTCKTTAWNLAAATPPSFAET
eukprot:6491437-Amphidinium_carterae.1